MKKCFILLFIVLSSVVVEAQSQEVPFTLDDRDRIMRTEQKIEAQNKEFDNRVVSLRNEMNTRFDALMNRIEVLYWGFGIVIMLLIFIFGYIIWDRRTFLHPVQQKTEELDSRYQRLERIMKERSKEDPKLAEILKSAGLL